MPAQILIADDDDIARDVMAHVLSDRGHTVTLADDGLTALQALRRRRFDVAVFDYHMPLLDGVSAVRRIVRDPARTDETRFIGVTADPDGLETRDTGGTIFDAVVQKPLNLSMFVATVESCLADLRRAADAQDVMAAWRRAGFERRPRARFAGEVPAECADLYGALFDLSRPGNPDVVLVTEQDRAGMLAELRTDGNLFTLPMVDVAGRWGRLADATFDAADRSGWDGVASVAKSFASRRAQLTSRFITAATLPEKLLAYVFVSGRDLAPSNNDADEWTPAYPGFFPVRRLRDTAERLVHAGLLDRCPVEREGVEVSPFAPARYALTRLAVARLTGDTLPDAFPVRAQR